ncbi:MAG: ABC transporter ATP-binding protein [Caldilineaceae bacterium]
MTTVVHFEDVSKQYRLGINQASLLKSLSEGIRNAIRRSVQTSAENQLLWALRNVSFDLTKGESLALIGKNGAGKSTLLKLLANITRPTSGRIEVTGRLAALIELGSGFHPDLTGRENVYLNGAVLGLRRKEIQRRFDEIVAFSEIEQFIDTPVKRYSSGMLVRLGFAVASCIEPDILLVDEVLAVGDASFQQKCLMRIQSLLANGTSIIFVSHNINMVEAVCASALYLKKGQVVYSGKTARAIETYERDLHEERARKLEENQGDEKALSLTGVEITQVEILATNGGSTDDINSKCPVEIRVHYTAQREIDKADAVIRIVRSDGLTCTMMRTAIDDEPLLLCKGHGVFAVILEPLQLIGGAYFVNAYLSTENDLVLLATGRSDWFYVAGSPLSYEEQSGVFEPHRRWIHPSAMQHYIATYQDDGSSATVDGREFLEANTL